MEVTKEISGDSSNDSEVPDSIPDNDNTKDDYLPGLPVTKSSRTISESMNSERTQSNIQNDAASLTTDNMEVTKEISGDSSNDSEVPDSIPDNDNTKDDYLPGLPVTESSRTISESSDSEVPDSIPNNDNTQDHYLPGLPVTRSSRTSSESMNSERTQSNIQKDAASLTTDDMEVTKEISGESGSDSEVPDSIPNNDNTKDDYLPGLPVTKSSRTISESMNSERTQSNIQKDAASLTTDDMEVTKEISGESGSDSGSESGSESSSDSVSDSEVSDSDTNYDNPQDHYLFGLPVTRSSRSIADVDNREHRRKPVKEVGDDGSSDSGDNTTGNESKIYVMRTNNDGEKRCYDKVAYCLFCSKPQKKLQVHLEQHETEMEVGQYQAERSKQKRLMLLTKLRNRGNHKHNYEVMEEGKGGLVVVYRPNYEANPNDYQPCCQCLGWYARTEMWKHRCLFSTKDKDGITTKKRVNNVQAGRLLLPPAVNTQVPDLLHRILAGLRHDSVALCIKNDKLIVDLGKKLSFKLAHDEENFNSIRCKLREVARLVLEYRLTTGIDDAGLAALISPTAFDDVLHAVRQVSGFNNDTHLFQTPSLALKLGHSLKKAANILLSRAIKESNSTIEKSSRDFITLCEKEWDFQVSSHALRTMYQQKRNNPKMLPLTSDVVSLSTYLRKETETYLERLDSELPEVDKMDFWKKLNKVILTHLIVFNRRRQGEVSKMTVDDFSQVKKGESHLVEGQMEMMAQWEQELVKVLWRVEVVGKRGRTVPVLMTDFVKSSIDTLMKYRNGAQVSETNKYLFAVAKLDTNSHIRGSDCLREHSNLCGAKQPALLRSTRLRKHIATMSQLMNLRDNELDVLSNYMGHDIHVHRNFYRLPDCAQQVAKISKILFAMEGKGGNPVQLLGKAKSIDELQIHPNEGKSTRELEVNQSNEESSGDEDSDDDYQPDLPAGKVQKNDVNLSSAESEGCIKRGQKRKMLEGYEEKRKTPTRKKWTELERTAVLKHLHSFIEKRKLPGKREIDKCLEAEKCLRNRSWKNVKDFVRNHIKTRASTSKSFKY
ncbi:hypothetical protein BSL78_22310 [Apostichopus japonicus]|uniref:Uncharacterized protein n=1 Tax=Stichopus japonicus TaxID=307972 RepID=A0A2G8JYK1_STIJA|nr:hypothetical protein BSL78_22310 [Apostichopus japonicus]